jgi:hypothetical protein
LLDPQSAAAATPDCAGRMMPRKEAVALLNRTYAAVDNGPIHATIHCIVGRAHRALSLAHHQMLLKYSPEQNDLEPVKGFPDPESLDDCVDDAVPLDSDLVSASECSNEAEA